MAFSTFRVSITNCVQEHTAHVQRGDGAAEQNSPVQRGLRQSLGTGVAGNEASAALRAIQIFAVKLLILMELLCARGKIVELQTNSSCVYKSQFLPV